MTGSQAESAASGDWWREKHERLRKYVDASRAVRRKYIGPGTAGATYIDPFCGSPVRTYKNSGERFDSGAVAACRKAAESNTLFSEVHIGDLSEIYVDETAEALEALGVRVHRYVGPASKTVPKICAKLHPQALHVAFLDPNGLAQLPFGVLRELAHLRSMDMIVHISAMGLQRNLSKFLKSANNALDQFAPGWRENVDVNQRGPSIRSAVYRYWFDLVKNLDMRHSQEELVRGEQNIRLYYLVLVARHDMAHYLWNQIRNIHPQRDLGI